MHAVADIQTVCVYHTDSMNVKPEDTARAQGERPARTLKADQSEATRAALIGAARELFAARGYAAVATEELFRAVYEDVERGLVEQIAASALSSASDPLAALHAGAQAFLDACEDPAVQRIALVDAPSVLGWERWREIGLRYGFGLVQATVQAAMDAGLIEPQPVVPLAHLLLGAIDEGAMLIARAQDDGTTRTQVGASVARFLDALRPRE